MIRSYCPTLNTNTTLFETNGFVLFFSTKKQMSLQVKCKPSQKMWMWKKLNQKKTNPNPLYPEDIHNNITVIFECVPWWITCSLTLCRQMNIGASTCCSNEVKPDDGSRKSLSEAHYKLRKAKSLVNRTPFIIDAVTPLWLWPPCLNQRGLINVRSLWRLCNQQASCIMEQRLHRDTC